MTLPEKVGYTSSICLVGIGLGYIVVTGFGIYQAGLDDPIRDPILAMMEGLTLLSAPFIVAMMAAVHETASRDRRIFAIMALVFSGIMAGLTSAVHFVALTAGRQAGLTTLEWPSGLYAVELLAWDVFLGLALLFAGLAFVGPGIRALVRWSLLIAGGLALLGAIGPVLGDMALQRIGIAGYGIGLPIAAWFLSRFFLRRSGTKSQVL
jgi:hypothetical protein